MYGFICRLHDIPLAIDDLSGMWIKAVKKAAEVDDEHPGPWYVWDLEHFFCPAAFKVTAGITAGSAPFRERTMTVNCKEFWAVVDGDYDEVGTQSRHPENCKCLGCRLLRGDSQGAGIPPGPRKT